MLTRILIATSFSILMTFLSLPTFGQGFGRNKPKYKKFDFEVYRTSHFDIYHYFKNQQTIERLANQSELWNNHIESLMQNKIAFQNPIIFYADHGDFQQTNTISSAVGVTTGGVTEAYKNRVTMPVSISNQKTFQVLGHELVHAFQYDMVLRGDSTSLENMANLPLFMVEGMAEYITRGRIDPYTSMWMRDIVLNDKIPTIKEMFSPKYFPYRYGQAFWAVITDKYGDTVMRKLLMATAKHGLEIAAPMVLKEDLDGLTIIWKTALKEHYHNVMPNDKEDFIGRKLLDDKNAGNINISPSLSPNGKHVIFLSEKGIFTTELFLADASTGKVVRKIASALKDNNFDHLDAFESSGTWSPDSKRFAFVGFNKGRNKIFIKTIDNAKNDQEFFVQGINAINSPSWSPNARHIVFTGLKDGQVDLFMVDIKSQKVTQLTNTVYSELHPAWSSDGEQIVYASDEISMTERPTAGPWYYNIAVLDVENKNVENYNIFPFADNLNPQFDENDDIWFLSDRDGFRNIYKYEITSDSLFQQTDFMTGVSGISQYAPALSVARKRDKIIFTHYYDGKYQIYGAKEKAFLRKSVDKKKVDKSAGTLPGNLSTSDEVNVGLATISSRSVPDAESFQSGEYKAKLTLDDVRGSAGTGVSSGLYGTQIGGAGGIQGIWSDLLGDHTIGAVASINGELEDFGLGAQYINKKGRIHWGFSLAHAAPQRAVLGDNLLKPTEQNNIFAIENRVVRIFQDQASLIGIYPISSTLRIEGNISTSYRYYSDRLYTTFVDNVQVNDKNQVLGYRVLGEERDKIKHNGNDFVVPVNFNGQNFNYQFRYGFLHSAGAALVSDNSYFGITSPLAGHRYRVGVDQYAGLYQFTQATADFRKYFYLKPVSFAIRGFHQARYGKDENSFSPTYLGWQGLIRGIGDVGSVQELYDRYGLIVPNIQGSKILMGQAEVRLPFTGPKQISVIKSKFLFSDIAAFLDTGVAFDKYEDIVFSSQRDQTAALGNQKSVVIMTAGLSLRINLFGAFILEPYYAVPLRENAKPEFGLNFLLPGW